MKNQEHCLSYLTESDEALEMDIVHGSRMEFIPTSLSHRDSGLAFKELFIGKENTLENYSLNLARQKNFFSPIHHHNFDQVRYAVKGGISLGPDMILEEGQLSYHPEGAYYGPQEDSPDEERHVLVLQCGGASRNGYMSFKQLQGANNELSKRGTFEGGKFHSPDGSVKDGYQALWEYLSGRDLQYPKPRYPGVIIMDPASFSWLPVKSRPNDLSNDNAINGEIGGNPNVKVWKKTLGVFSERELRVEELKIAPGGRIEVGGEHGIHILVVLEGDGSIGSEGIERESAVRLEPGNIAEIVGESRDLVLLHYELSLLL